MPKVSTSRTIRRSSSFLAITTAAVLMMVTAAQLLTIAALPSVDIGIGEGCSVRSNAISTAIAVVQRNRCANGNCCCVSRPIPIAASKVVHRAPNENQIASSVSKQRTKIKLATKASHCPDSSVDQVVARIAEPNTKTATTPGNKIDQRKRLIVTATKKML